MIEKSRLKELIEQGAMIYIIKSEPFIAGYANELKIVPIVLNNCYGISTEKYNKTYNCKPQFYYSAFVFQNICDADKVFETKEEAEWALEFGNITRTETLSLPNYKVAKTYIDTSKFILEDNSDFKFLLLSNPNNIIIVDKQQGNQIFNKPLTEANYTEACRLAKKLFLGEVEDD